MSSIVERLSGAGALRTPAREELEVTYSLTITEDWRQLRGIHGRISVSRFDVFGETCQLQLEDGRLLDVLMVGGGEVKGSGPIRDP